MQDLCSADVVVVARKRGKFITIVFANSSCCWVKPASLCGLLFKLKHTSLLADKLCA